MTSGKDHIFWEGRKILQNLHCRFVLCSASEIYARVFAKFCGLLRIYMNFIQIPLKYVKGGFKSEDTREFSLLQNKCSKSLSWADNLNKLFTDLGGNFKFSAQDSDLEYLFWRSKNPPVSSDLKPPLIHHRLHIKENLFGFGVLGFGC